MAGKSRSKIAARKAKPAVSLESLLGAPGNARLPLFSVPLAINRNDFRASQSFCPNL